MLAKLRSNMLIAMVVLSLCLSSLLSAAATPIATDTPPTACETKYQGSLVGYWNFDNASDPMQPTVGTLRGAVVGTTKTATGIAGRALEFDGYTYIDYGTGMNIPAWNQYTVSIWFKNDDRLPHATGYGQKIIDKTTWFSDFYLSVYTNVSPAMLQFKTYNSAWNSIQLADPNYITGTWHHAVMVRNGGLAELWVDGVLKGTHASFETVNNNQPLLLGYSLSGDDFQRQYWGGYLDEFAVFNRALSSSEIGELFANSAAGSSYCVSVTAKTAAITIVKEAQPKSIQDFAYYGPFGKFLLDDAVPSDGDAVPNAQTYTVNPGSYNFAEGVFQSWYLADIRCVGTGQSVNDMINRSVRVTVKAGEQMTCTFVTQRRVNLQAIKFNDLSGDGIRQPNEPTLTPWEFRFYKSDGTLINHKVTDANGSAVQNNVIPGSFKVCETPKASWANTLPGQVDPLLNLPCYNLTLQPGQNASLLFGNTKGIVTRPATEIDPLSGVAVDVLADINEPESEEVEGELNQSIYLPLLNR